VTRERTQKDPFATLENTSWEGENDKTGEEPRDTRMEAGTWKNRTNSVGSRELVNRGVGNFWTDHLDYVT